MNDRKRPFVSSDALKNLKSLINETLTLNDQSDEIEKKKRKELEIFTNRSVLIESLIKSDVTDKAPRRIITLKFVEFHCTLNFVHSFFVVPQENKVVITYTDYCGIRYCSGIQKDNLVAFQFHPEKSGSLGIQVFKNFKEMVSKERENG